MCEKYTKQTPSPVVKCPVPSNNFEECVVIDLKHFEQNVNQSFSYEDENTVICQKPTFKLPEGDT